ncbi:hypothetical protein ACQUZK_09900, partial [Streptococcus pyogenes]|uniref:hypothetical protein n=1 Tax=Streptococcus pyogenes TaxID=1314 RepID=UPI003DA15E3A
MSDRPLTSGAPGRRAAVDLTPSPLAQALRVRPGKPPGAVQLTGYLGDSTRADRVRLYLDPGLLSWLEVSRADVLH